MKVLWFTHIPCDAVNRHLGRPTRGTGFWIHSLVQPLLQSGQVQLAIATASHDPAYHFEEGGVEYFNIPQHKVLDTFDLFPRARTSGYLRQAAALVESWKPDLIHVHGTERFLGLVRSRGLTSVPTIVSIQGLMEPYAPWTRGEMTWRDILSNTTLWEITRHATMFTEVRRRWRSQVPVERDVIAGADAMIGRTEWDHAHVRNVNPSVRYFHVDEMLRPDFWAALPWRVDQVQRGSIFTTGSPSPLKGLPVLLRALSTLRRWGLDVRLTVSGMNLESNRRSFSGYIARLVGSLGLQEFVTFTGWANASDLVNGMRQSNCFVSPSLIENSSNALCEAQLLGMPCVATHAGGTPTIVQDEQTGLLFTRSDDVMLARQIERILIDDGLAERLGRQARERAKIRHDPQTIVDDLLGCYRAMARPSPDNAPALDSGSRAAKAL